MLLDKGLGMALKICDGSKRAAECLIVTLLVMLGYLNKDDEDFLNFLNFLDVDKSIIKYFIFLFLIVLSILFGKSVSPKINPIIL